MRTPALKLSLFSGFCALAAFAAPAETVSEKRIDLIFRPPVGECMAISADGNIWPSRSTWAANARLW